MTERFSRHLGQQVKPIPLHCLGEQRDEPELPCLEPHCSCNTANIHIAVLYYWDSNDTLGSRSANAPWNYIRRGARRFFLSSMLASSLEWPFRSSPLVRTRLPQFPSQNHPVCWTWPTRIRLASELARRSTPPRYKRRVT
jgi:hypothetical protein